MDFAEYSLRIAGGIIIIVGAACGLGCKILWGGRPESWIDISASDTLIRRVALGLLIVSAFLLITGIGAALRFAWARQGGAVAILLFVAGGFLGNYKLFGDIRPMHTGANTVIAAVVLWLLWVGLPG